MWIDTNYDDIPRMFNAGLFRQIKLENRNDCWQIEFSSAAVLGVFSSFDAAHDEFVRLRNAIRLGANYHLVNSH